jgi:threonine aldolase
MVPQIKVKFRKRYGIPFSVERLTGIQFRCRLCNQIFINENDFNKHIIHEFRNQVSAKINQKCPKLHDMVNCMVYYSEDVLDALKSSKIKRLKKDDIYDGMLKSKE